MDNEYKRVWNKVF